MQEYLWGESALETHGKLCAYALTGLATTNEGV